jgi:hypothetical protein
MHGPALTPRTRFKFFTPPSPAPGYKFYAGKKGVVFKDVLTCSVIFPYDGVESTYLVGVIYTQQGEIYTPPLGYVKSFKLLSLAICGF